MRSTARRGRIVEEENFLDVMSVVKTVGYYHNIHLEYGKWPMQMHITPEKSVIFLPLIKGRGEEFHRKLRMLAAHEVAHAKYSRPDLVPEDSKLTFMEIRKSMTPGQLNILNWIEDIRIELLMEHETDTRILPMPFSEFRRLFNRQVVTKGDPEQLLIKMQYHLMEQDFEIAPHLELVYENRFRKLVQKVTSSFKGAREEESLQQGIDLTYKIEEIIRELFPQQQSKGSGQEGEKGQEGEEGKESAGSNGQGSADSSSSQSGSSQSGSSQSKGNSDISDMSDENLKEAIKQSLHGGEHGSGSGQDQEEIPEEVIEDILEKLKKHAEGKKQSNIESREQRGNAISAKELKELNNSNGEATGIKYIEDVEQMSSKQAKNYSHRMLTKYNQAIEEFRRLFSGGWRAPRRGIRTGREAGDINTDDLYKARLGGKDRTIYQSRTKKSMPGLNILVCLDNSGSMDSHTKHLSESGSLLSQSIRGLSGKSTKMRVVYFSDNVLVAKDWNTPYKYFTIDDLKYHQCSTPTGGVLEREYSSLILQEGDKFLVVVTDGYPNRSSELEEQIARYRAKGVYTLAIIFGGMDAKEFGFDKAISYDSDDLKNLPSILARDVRDLVKTYSKDKLRAVG